MYEFGSQRKVDETEKLTKIAGDIIRLEVYYRRQFSRKTTLTGRMIFGKADAAGLIFVEKKLANKKVE